MMRWLLGCIVLLGTGCAVLPPVAEGEGRLPEQLAAFTLEGKVAWRHPEGRGNANLSWVQAEDDFRLLLTGPLGQGSVRLESDGDGVRLDTPEGPRYAHQADDLLADTLGFPVPIAQARWWVLGVAAPTAVAGSRAGGRAEVMERDVHGRPQVVRQDGWQIAWSDRRLVEGYALPRRVELSRAETRLTLVIGAWSLSGDRARMASALPTPAN
ncbi:MAG: outer membrane lipoprotein LolB [Gammaproteobacteria bacterium]|nr:MAG: outer membrane lipoprotein LolB [Gammaproteobacteria bacterium]